MYFSDPRFAKLKNDMLSQFSTDPQFDDPSHDLSHIERVLRSCLEIGEANQANLEVLMPAGLLHDVVNVPKNHPDRAKASSMAAEKAAEILKNYDYNQDEIAAIGQAILEHSFSAGHSPTSLESAILQDADRLDAIGSIGIMRMVTCGNKFGASFYNPEDPMAENRDYEDKKFSLDHFYTKLLKLESMMNTKQGKAEAKKRTDFMKSFLEQLKDEIGVGENGSH